MQMESFLRRFIDQLILHHDTNLAGHPTTSGNALARYVQTAT
jgi:hypothetical protein